MTPTLHLPTDYQERVPSDRISTLHRDVRFPDLASLVEFLCARAELDLVWCIGIQSVRLLRGSMADTSLVCVDTAAALVAHSIELDEIRCHAWDWTTPLILTALETSLVLFSQAFERSPDPIATMRVAAILEKQCPFLLISGPDRCRVGDFGNDGPPQRPEVCREWTLDEFCRFARDYGISTRALHGYTRSDRFNEEKDEFLLITGTNVDARTGGHTPRVGAIIHTYNEADVIEATIRHLAGQGVSAHVFDNWSTDETPAILHRLAGAGYCHFGGRFPGQDTKRFDLQQQLRQVAKFAAESPYDWLIYCDADELRCSPWDGLSLNEAISFVDALGYNAIDFTVLNFVFTNERPFCGEQIQDYRSFDFGRHPAHKAQVKAWKNKRTIIDLESTGGHRAAFEGRRIYPIKFLTKHFPLRSVEHAEKKLHEERFPRFEKEYQDKSWHRQYDTYRLVRNLRPWRQFEVKNYYAPRFNAEYLVERVSGIGIETVPWSIPNLATIMSFLDALQQVPDDPR